MTGTLETTPDEPTTADRCPSAFPYWQAQARPGVRRLRRLIRAATGFDILPTDEQARALCNDLYSGDPTAERFVEEVYHGEPGPKEARVLLDRALADGIDSVPEAPDAMKALFGEFETVPDWVHPDLVEQGAEIWRR